MAKPLTKVSKEGKRYTRQTRVEAQIDEALAQDIPTLKRRLAVADSDSADYLMSECLVHLIRESQRIGNRELGNAAVQVLFVRCEAILKSKIDEGRVANAEFIREEILGEFGVMLAGDGTGDDPCELDYFECRFNAAFRTLRIDMLRRAQKQRRRFHPLRMAARAGDDDDDPAAHDEPPVLARTEELAAANEMLDMLSENERKAFVLRHEMGYEVESKEPDTITVATICGVSGRTVRNWLSNADKRLSELNKEDI